MLSGELAAFFDGISTESSDRVSARTALSNHRTQRRSARKRAEDAVLLASVAGIGSAQEPWRTAPTCGSQVQSLLMFDAAGPKSTNRFGQGAEVRDPVPPMSRNEPELLAAQSALNNRIDNLKFSGRGGGI